MFLIRKSANSLLFLFIISTICSTVNSFQDFQCQTEGPCGSAGGNGGGNAIGATEKVVANTNCDAGGGPEYKFKEREFTDEYLEKLLHLKGKLLDMPISICKEQNKETTKKINLGLDESCDQTTKKPNDLDSAGECNKNVGSFQTIPMPTTEDACKEAIATTPAPTTTEACVVTTTEACVVTTTEACVVTTTEACVTTHEKCVTIKPTTAAVECIETTTEADCMQPTTLGTTPDCIAPTMSTKTAECIESTAIITTTEHCADLPDDSTKSKNSKQRQNNNANRSTNKKNDAKLKNNPKESAHTKSTAKSKDTKKLGFAGHMLQFIKDILLLKSQGKEEKSSYDETNDDDINLNNKKLSSIEIEEIENLLKATKDFDRTLRASLEQPSLKRYRRNRHHHGRHKRRKRRRNSHKNSRNNHRKGQNAAKLRQKKMKGKKLRKYYKYNVEVDRGEIWPNKREENVRHLFL